MTERRAHIGSIELARALPALLGTKEQPQSVDRLRGGSKKGVYRVTMPSGATVVAYVWHESENFWPSDAEAEAPDVGDPFSDASGADLFVAANETLIDLGVRTPRLEVIDTTKALLAADVAVVEDVGTRGDLSACWELEPAVGEEATAALGQMLELMHRCRSHAYGKVAFARSAPPRLDPPETIVRLRAERDLADAAEQLPPLAAARQKLEEKLSELAGLVRPRQGYGLIHGELGPDHVLVDGQGSPVLIDIEGVMFFDVEWEHAFLRLRFDRRYQLLAPEALDQARLDFYQLALYLSLCAGPLRLLEGDFPQRDAMLAIIDANARRALALVGS